MNSITLTGRLVKDVHSGKGYSAFTLAVDKGLSKEKMAEYKEQNKPTADFIPCMAFSKTGELAKKFLRRGSKILVQGSLSIRNVSEGDVYKSFTNVIVSSMEFLDNKVGGDKHTDEMENDLEYEGEYEEQVEDYLEEHEG